MIAVVTGRGPSWLLYAMIAVAAAFGLLMAALWLLDKVGRFVAAVQVWRWSRRMR